MPPYSLIEYKLRRYLYLGHKDPIYIPSVNRASFWPRKYHDDVTGVRIIGKIIEKEVIEDINSIVPIILKIKKEDSLYDDKLLIFILAVCTRFKLKICEKMAVDAYAAVSLICTDGLKLLMFTKFCEDAKSILYDEGYLPNISSGCGKGFRKTISNWYLKKDPLLTTEQIVMHTSYNGWTHKDVIKLIRIHTTDPRYDIFIKYTLLGMKKVEEVYGSKMKNIQIKSTTDTFENKQLKYIYNLLNQVHNLHKMDENALLREIKFHCWGKTFEIIPQKMLKNHKILTALVTHIPLRDLLDNTFYFAKQGLFHNLSPNDGLWEYILRFNNSVLLKKSRIHPIESYLEYVKYSRTINNIFRLQNSISSKQYYSNCVLNDNNKVKEVVEINKTMKIQNYDSNNLSHTTKETESINKIFDENNTEPDGESMELGQIFKSTINDFNQTRQIKMMLKPPPKLVGQLSKFLSEGLIKKTLENLEPTGRRIIITYDNRRDLKISNCLFSNLLRVEEAITLIILSLIYPEKRSNKPTIYNMDKSKNECFMKIKINYEYLDFHNLESILYKGLSKNYSGKKIPAVNPVSVMRWTKKKKQEYDVFVFLGTNTMNLYNINKAIKEYQTFLKKPVKIIVCCLNGKHVLQTKICCTNILFTVGFDKNIGKIIHSFINEEF